WRARLGKNVVGDLECAALAHRRSNVKEGIGTAELTQPIAAEAHRVECQSLALFEVLAERLVGQRCVTGEIFEPHAVSAYLVHDLEHTLHDLLALVARLGERLPDEELQRRVRLTVGLQRAYARLPVLL